MSKPQLYTADWCPYCVGVRAWLDKNNIGYEILDVDQPGIREKMNQETNDNQTIPTLVIANEYYVNPSVKTLNELFSNKKKEENI
jgi:thioredoxin reductase (NADPH)